MILFVIGLLQLSLSPAAEAAVPQFWNLPAAQNPFQSSHNYSAAHPPLPPEAYDESINHQPGLNLYQSSGELSDLFGANGSQLCGPTSLTHRFAYLQYWRQERFALAGFGDQDGDGTADTYSDRIRYFFQTCHTDKDQGTSYHSLLGCIRDYITASGYKPWAYMVGTHAPDSPTGNLADMQRPVTVTDVRTYMAYDLAMIMAVGWYNKDAVTGKYTRAGGHIFNVYGYAYKTAWGEDGIVLKVVNPMIDYSGRPSTEMFDDVNMLYAGADSPNGQSYSVEGTGFLPEYHGYVEDLFVALPTAP